MGLAKSLSKCTTLKLADNQLPRSTFCATECVQGWVVTPVKRCPLQDFGHKIGEDVCPGLGLYLELCGTATVQLTLVTYHTVIL